MGEMYQPGVVVWGPGTLLTCLRLPVRRDYMGSSILVFLHVDGTIRAGTAYGGVVQT